MYWLYNDYESSVKNQILGMDKISNDRIWKINKRIIFMLNK